jgi:phosphoribosylamine---glycine ligase
VKVLVIGGGGREHAIAAALARDPDVAELHAAPGNPGVAAVATLHPVTATDGQAVGELARRIAADLVVIGPEAPLVAGVADAVRDVGVACFGPSAAAAEIEGSKAFAKDVMQAAGIPTASGRLCQSAAEVAGALQRFGAPYVVKDDGLAAGKGVLVTPDRAAAAAHAAACGRVVVEEFLDGPEVSVFAICGGGAVLPMQPAQDFKRLGDGDAGPNTGGMGAYTPLPWAPAKLVEEVRERVLQPAVDELARRSRPFAGVLYAGLALTSAGVKVVEFNARFGDPETQPLLELLETPLASVLLAAANGRLVDVPPLQWRPGAAVTVVAAAPGYPAAPVSGAPISGVSEAERIDGVSVFHAGTSSRGGRLTVSGGRVLAVTGTGRDLSEARQRAYAGIGCISFDGMQVRRDIALHASIAAGHPNSPFREHLDAGTATEHLDAGTASNQGGRMRP